MSPRDYFNYISRHNYQRRLKMDPLWCSTVVGGVSKDSGEVFLGCTDLYGLRLEENFILTGLASHYCQVLMQNSWSAEMSEGEARQLIENCMRTMFYRDKKAHDKVQIVTVSKEKGVTMHDPITIDSEWNLPFFKEQTNEKFRPMRIQL